MKVAIVHDSLVEMGGAERVLSEVLKIFREAHVYTSVADPHMVKQNFANTNVHVLPIPQSFFSHHTSLFQSLSPLFWRLFDFKKYDLVLAISGHMMSNLINPVSAVFIQYLLSPPKNIYRLEPATNLQRIFPYHMYLRDIYERSLKSTPHIITLSYHMQHVFHELFGIDSSVIYPPVIIPRQPPPKHKGKYFLIVSRLDRSKSIELAIFACNTLKEQLLIVGETNEESYGEYLRSISGPTITFLGYRSDREIQKIFSEAKAFIFTAGNEDFGIAPVEAMAHGIPVIASEGGGVKETIIDHKTGLLFRPHELSSLISALKQFHPSEFTLGVVHRWARKFSSEKFRKKILTYVETTVGDHNV